MVYFSLPKPLHRYAFRNATHLCQFQTTLTTAGGREWVRGGNRCGVRSLKGWQLHTSTVGREDTAHFPHRPFLSHLWRKAEWDTVCLDGSQLQLQPELEVNEGLVELLKADFSQIFPAIAQK